MAARLFALSVGSLFIVSLLAAPGFAIVADGDDATTETAPTGSYAMDWNYVYPYKTASAVAVDPYWLLTTRHVSDDAPTWSMTIGATTYTEQEVIYHSASADPVNSHTADLALVRVDHALPGHYDILTQAFVNGIEGVLVGYGYEEGSLNTNSYDWSTSTTPMKRWGTNCIDQEIQKNINGYLPFVLELGFSRTDAKATPYEAGLATGDSGGGYFVYDGSDWLLAGINLGTDGDTAPYDGSLVISASHYEAWVSNTVPEPASISLLGLGGLALLRRRRRA
jgi:hypothetical protein